MAIKFNKPEYLDQYLSLINRHLTPEEIRRYKEAVGVDEDTARKLIRRANRLSNKNRNRTLINEAKDKPCKDCGVTLPSELMTFDHLHTKTFTIGSDYYSKSIRQIEEEIAKCHVVCPQCHYNRELRKGSYNYLPVDAIKLMKSKIKEMNNYLATQKQGSK